VSVKFNHNICGNGFVCGRYDNLIVILENVEMKRLIVFAIATTVFFISCQKQEPRSSGDKRETPVQKEDTKTGAVLLAEAKEKLNIAKEKLMQEGKYNCCIKEACNYCALQEASCPCYKELKAGEQVCIECYAGWQQGKGGDDTMKKEDVRTDFVRHEHKH